YINTGEIQYTYDRHSIEKDKMHLGLGINYQLDLRNNPVLPTQSLKLDADLSSYFGVNSASKSFTQFKINFSFYTTLNSRKTLVLANRTGSVVTVGQPAFYQYA